MIEYSTVNDYMNCVGHNIMIIEYVRNKMGNYKLRPVYDIGSIELTFYSFMAFRNSCHKIVENQPWFLLYLIHRGLQNPNIILLYPNPMTISPFGLYNVFKMP